ncbi:MAG: hypothetical protein BMS9Abin01_2838 [Gammaproteobacteria bacterium]|nr:MAG: hypothetical protein BMS9Abin01_2838 [Gammaproteobacteria bacterium]
MLAALLLVGCSTIKFAYNNVDWMLLSKADYYLDLSDAQRQRAKQLVAARMQVHRREELPVYVAALKEIRVMLTDDFSPAELELIREQIPALYRRTMRDTIPGIASLLAELDDTQIDYLQARFEERNREFESDFMPKSMKVRLERRVERSTEIFEFFIGELRPEQVELVARHRNAMPLTADDWLAYHQARQKELLTILRRRASDEELERFLIGWWVDLAGQPPALKRKMAINTDAWSRMILELDTTLDARQRQKLLDKLDLFIEELGALVPGKAT